MHYNWTGNITADSPDFLEQFDEGKGRVKDSIVRPRAEPEVKYIPTHTLLLDGFGEGGKGRKREGEEGKSKIEMR